MHVTKGDTVRVMRATIRQGRQGHPRLPEDRAGDVEGVNIVKRHARRRRAEEPSRSSKCGADPPLERDAARSEDEEPTRIRRRIDNDGTKERIAAKVGTVDPAPRKDSEQRQDQTEFSNESVKRKTTRRPSAERRQQGGAARAEGRWERRR